MDATGQVCSSGFSDEVDEPGPSTSTANSSLFASPQGVKHYTKTWYKSKLEGLGLLVTNLEKPAKSVPIEEIPGLLCMKKVKPKESTKNVRLTQVHGSMLAKDILTLAESGEICQECAY